MIVKIAAVPPSGRIQVSTSSSSSAAAIAAAAAAAVAAGKDAARKPVCICNTQQQDELAAMLAKNATLDQLLHVDTGSAEQQSKTAIATASAQHPPSIAAAASAAAPIVKEGYVLEKSYHQINGSVYEITRQVPVSAAGGGQTAAIDHPIDIGTAKPTLLRKKSLPKTLSQSHLPLRKTDSTASAAVEKPQPPVRMSSRPLSHAGNGTDTIAAAAESFDRSQRQRHSSRSAGAATGAGAYDECDEWCQHKDPSLHQRHSSGPTDLKLQQHEIAEWLLKLPHKRPPDGSKGAVGRTSTSSTTTAGAVGTSSKSMAGGGASNTDGELQLSKSLKDELVQILKRPLQRQHSGAALLRNDIIDWLRAQSCSNKILPAPLDNDAPTPVARTSSAAFAAAMTVKSSSSMVASATTMSTSMAASATPSAVEHLAPLPQPRKRHSLGQADAQQYQSQQQHIAHHQHHPQPPQQQHPYQHQQPYHYQHQHQQQQQQPHHHQHHRHSHHHHQLKRQADEDDIPDWIPYPLARLSAAGREKLGVSQSSCVDINRKSKSSEPRPASRGDRRLRHSASEMVTPTSSNIAPEIRPNKTERTNALKSPSCPKATTTATPTSSRIDKPSLHTTCSECPATGVPMVSHRSRRHRTQRSATVTDMSAAIAAVNAATATTQHSRSSSNGQHRKSLSGERPSGRSSSLPRCTDPTCPLLPICTDPTCCTYECYNFAGAAAVDTSTRCTADCYEYRCNSLPRCMDSKCLCKPHHQSEVNLVKHHSLPRCATSNEHTDQPTDAAVGKEGKSHPHRTPSGGNVEQHFQHYQHQPLQRGDSRASLPRTARPSNGKSRIPSHQYHQYINTNSIASPHSAHIHNTTTTSASAAGNGKLLTKSVSAVSLNSRRRRHKTVHFGENLLREVCQNRRLIEPLQKSAGAAPAGTATALVAPSGTAPLNSNIQLLYNFVEGVMSSWVDDDEDDAQVHSGAESEPERGTMRPVHRCNRLRLQTIRRVVTEAAELRGTLKLGNSRYRHRHWRGTAKECNERFLKKVRHTGWRRRWRWR